MLAPLKHAARLGTAAVGPLVEALKDPDGEAREGAAQVLGKLRQEPAVEPLLAALRDGEANVRASAARALGRLADPRAVVPLIALLSDCDSRVRGTAAEVLGNLGDARAVEPLMAFVQNERGWVCQEAVKALRCLRDPRAVEALIAALGDTAAQTCTEAALALADLGEPAWRQWVTGDSTDYARLGRCGDPRALAPLVRALADDTIAQYAARALGEMGDPRAIEPLARALMSESKEVRAAAALALARFGDQRAIRPLIRTLCHDGLTRLAAAQALAGLGQPEWMQWVTGCSGDAVRLGASGHPLAIEPLLEGIQRDFCSDDREIIQVLGKIGDARAVGPLLGKLRDRSRFIRRAAAAALVEIATTHPDSLRGRWQEAGQLITEPHRDVHQDSPHDDTWTGEEGYWVGPRAARDEHTDTGIGLAFPAAPSQES